MLKVPRVQVFILSGCFRIINVKLLYYNIDALICTLHLNIAAGKDGPDGNYFIQCIMIDNASKLIC